VIRYDHRDTGRSTSFPPGSPPYSDVDLANDALGVLDALGVHRAHLVGMSMGATLAQRIAVERPHRVLSLTLICAAPDLSTHRDPAAPDWSHRRTAVNHIVATTRDLGGPFTADDAHLRRLAERSFDRTHDMAATQANHHRCARTPPPRPGLGTITAPTLILHGDLDPLVPAAHAQALAVEIPGARLVRLEGVGHEFPPQAVWSQVIDEIRQTGRRRQPA
jgi:pimeloyl-ACP methyl ester carboxylesterase